jgi:hypothetical protein
MRREEALKPPSCELASLPPADCKVDITGPLVVCVFLSCIMLQRPDESRLRLRARCRIRNSVQIILLEEAVVREEERRSPVESER